jgi:type III secretion protein W
MSGINTDLRGLVNAFSSKQGVADTVAETARQEGSFKGQSVVIGDQATSLANAAEEMTFAASEKVEKKLAERKAGSKEAMRLDATELAQKYVNMMGQSTSSQKLHEFLDSMKKMGGKATEEQLRQLARESFGDVTEQYGALAYAEEALAQEGGNEELLAKVATAKEALMKEAGPAIRAGLNIATDVLTFSKQGLEQLE